MQYKQYGNQGPDISRLSFGAMRLPTIKEDNRNKVDFDKSFEVMRAAMEAGVNLFDSHHGYHGGDSEVAIGNALKGWTGQRIYVQTKTPWYNEKPTEYFEKLLYEALEKLGVDRIDYLLHHSMRMDVWKSRGKKFLKFTDWAINRGLIEKRGFSSHDTPENIKEFVDTGEFACMLVSYNWMNPKVRHVIAYASEKGMGVSVMNPVGGGSLATSTPQIMDILPGAKTAPEICLRFVLGTPGVTCTLSGMNTMAQVIENVAVAALQEPLSLEQERHLLNKLDEIERESREFCTMCGYCMPCEHGVNIPENFRLRNQAKLFGRYEWAKEQYANLKAHKDGDKSAEACEQCGSCEPKCPNDIPIIKQLQEVSEEFS